MTKLPTLSGIIIIRRMNGIGKRKNAKLLYQEKVPTPSV
jgi:hypothetical protein